ncbi:MAG: TetR/AcrR family transcriptional regulator [Cocleimonas sp.]
MPRNPEKTRNSLLQSAFEEIHEHGFQGMRVDKVLSKAELQKGAFYHHFSSKLDLGYAVIEEKVTPLMAEIWLNPLKDMKNPLEDLPKIIGSLSERIPAIMKEHGCPLNNLAQEMASQDEGFQKRIAAVFTQWISAYTELLKKAQKNKQMRTDVDAEDVARFVVGLIEGTISVFKAEQSAKQWKASQSQLRFYLQSLKA